MRIRPVLSERRTSALLSVLISLVIFALAIPSSAHASLQTEAKKLIGSDAGSGDDLGVSVAIASDTIIVGASAGGLTMIPGAAYIFQRDAGGPGNWGEVKKLEAPVPEVGSRFGHAVALSGDTAVVTAYLEDTGSLQGGAAHVFERDAGGPDNWGEVATLVPSDIEPFDFFGEAIAIDGDIVLVGSRLEDSLGASAGAIYVFERDQGGPGNWGEVVKITASDASGGGHFGRRLALSGDTAVVGGRVDDVSSGGGKVYVLERNLGGPDNWGEVTKLVPIGGANDDRFGTRVAINGDTAVVSDIWHDAAANNAGAAFVFERNEGGPDQWGQSKKIIASDAESNDTLATVSIVDDILIAGATHADAGSLDSGAAYVFERNEGGANNWGEVTKLAPSDPAGGAEFGNSVAIDGTTSVVGAVHDSEAAFDTGAAYVFEPVLNGPKLTPTETSMTPTITPTATPPPAVGGISQDVELRALSAETVRSSGSGGVALIATATLAGLASLGGAAWWSRRRLRAS